MNLHALDFNTIRGFGRRKPFLKICFLMDRDTKDEQIDELEKIDSDFFTNHFIVLERHELENYYLDEKLWEDLIMMDASSGIDMQIKKEDIPILILNYANETKINVYQKELNEKLRMQINSLSKMLGISSKIKCSATLPPSNDTIVSSISDFDIKFLSSVGLYIV